jgi:hypothetical protein
MWAIIVVILVTLGIIAAVLALAFSVTVVFNRIFDPLDIMQILKYPNDHTEDGRCQRNPRAVRCDGHRRQWRGEPPEVNRSRPLGQRARKSLSEARSQSWP